MASLIQEEARREYHVSAVDAGTGQRSSFYIKADSPEAAIQRVRSYGAIATDAQPRWVRRAKIAGWFAGIAAILAAGAWLVLG